MRHPSPTDDRQPPRNPSPPRGTFGGGLASPSSGTEVIYDSPEEHDEEDEPIYSPETKKRRDAQYKLDMEEFMRDVDAATSESDEFDPTGKTPEEMDAMIAKYHKDCHNSRMEANRRRDFGICRSCTLPHASYVLTMLAPSYNLRSCTLPHLYSPGVNAVFAARFTTADYTVPSNICKGTYAMVGSAIEEHVSMLERGPPLIRPLEDWSVQVSGVDDTELVSRYNEVERERAAREQGPVKSVPQTRLSAPIRPAGPIPPLDTKLLVSSKVFSLMSESATLAYPVVLRQSSGPPRRRNRPAKVTTEPSKVLPPSLRMRMGDVPERWP